MSWEVEYTDEFEAWWDAITADEQEDVYAAVLKLQEQGPALGRPFVDRVHTSAFQSMKELRPRSSDIRVLFMFDPRRTAVLLIGGNKAGRWNEWYEEMVPVADALYREHLIEIGRKEE